MLPANRLAEIPRFTALQLSIQSKSGGVFLQDENRLVHVGELPISPTRGGALEHPDTGGRRKIQGVGMMGETEGALD